MYVDCTTTKTMTTTQRAVQLTFIVRVRRYLKNAQSGPEMCAQQKTLDSDVAHHMHGRIMQMHHHLEPIK